MRNPNGRHACDRCGHDLGGGGVAVCAIVSDLHPDRPGDVITYEFCRDRPNPDNPDDTIKGCARKLTTPSMIAHYTERQEANHG